GSSCASLGKQARKGLRGVEPPTKIGLVEPEHKQRQADDADEGGDPLVVVEKDRAHPKLPLEVAVAPLDDPLVLVAGEHLTGAEPGEVGGQRVDAVGGRLGGDRLLVAPVAQAW